MSNMLAAVVVDAARREALDAAEISSSDEWSFSNDFRRREAFKGGGGGASSSSSCATTVDCEPDVVLPISDDDVHRFGFTLLPSLSCHSPTVLRLSEPRSTSGWMARSSLRVALLSFPGNCDSFQDETLWKIPLRNSRPTSRSGRRRRHCGTCVALPVCHRWEEEKEEEGKPSQRRASNHLYMICLPGFLFQVQGE